MTGKVTPKRLPLPRTMLGWDGTDFHAVKVKDDGTLLVEVEMAVPAFYNAYVCVRDKKAQHTGGGTFTQGAWRTRDINEEQADSADICSIAANRITLAAGTYRCLISAPAFQVQQHQGRLYNITDASVILVGTSELTAAADGVTNRSFVKGRFTISAEKVLEIQHRCDTTCDLVGFGWWCDFGDEIYTVAEFWREE